MGLSKILLVLVCPTSKSITLHNKQVEEFIKLSKFGIAWNWLACPQLPFPQLSEAFFHLKASPWQQLFGQDSPRPTLFEFNRMNFLILSSIKKKLGKHKSKWLTNTSPTAPQRLKCSLPSKYFYFPRPFSISQSFLSLLSERENMLSPESWSMLPLISSLLLLLRQQIKSHILPTFSLQGTVLYMKK